MADFKVGDRVYMPYEDGSKDTGLVGDDHIVWNMIIYPSRRAVSVGEEYVSSPKGGMWRSAKLMDKETLDEIDWCDYEE